ncbi:hypothetical protein KIPB_002362, partial [Kipferlia bialata]
ARASESLETDDTLASLVMAKQSDSPHAVIRDSVTTSLSQSNSACPSPVHRDIDRERERDRSDRRRVSLMCGCMGRSAQGDAPTPIADMVPSVSEPAILKGALLYLNALLAKLNLVEPAMSLSIARRKLVAHVTTHPNMCTNILLKEHTKARGRMADLLCRERDAALVEIADRERERERGPSIQGSRWTMEGPEDVFGDEGVTEEFGVPDSPSITAPPPLSQSKGREGERERVAVTQRQTTVEIPQQREAERERETLTQDDLAMLQRGRYSVVAEARQAEADDVTGISRIGTLSSVEAIDRYRAVFPEPVSRRDLRPENCPVIYTKQRGRMRSFPHSPPPRVGGVIPSVTPSVPGRRGRDKRRMGIHLTVFVHGFRGSSGDVRLLRDMLVLQRLTRKSGHSKYEHIISTCNEEYTTHSILELGQRLAEEIHAGCDMTAVERVDFVGHSLGGVIIRSALETELLAPLLPRLGHLLTFNAPHAGTVSGPNAIVSSALSVMRAASMAKETSLRDLNLMVSKQQEEPYLLTLAGARSLRMFRRIILVTAVGDGFVSPLTALARPIDPGSPAKKVAVQHTVSETMRHNMPNVTEVVLSYGLKMTADASILDEKLGRTAHIRALNDLSVIEMVLSVTGFGGST